jgi:signal transduction histidine kinase
VLEALERVQQRIEEGISQRFRNRLAGPGALELLAEVAHDMRSPLTAILMLVESMRRGERLPAALERRLGLVYGAAFGLSTLAENLFDVARGADLVVEPQPIPFSIKEKMQAVRDIVLPIAEEKGLLVEFQLRGADCRIGHSHAIQRVLLNLATNALKFTTRGFVRLAATDVGRSRVLFEVRDSGPGIEPRMLESICSAFRPMMHLGRVSFSTPGLGLSIAQKLVAVMGGTLQVQSEVGKGSCFFFELDLPIPADR